MENAIYKFAIEGEPISCEKHGMGHINRTFLVETDKGKKYILQSLSRAVFKDIPGLMGNVDAVTSFLRKKDPDPRKSLHLINTHSGDIYYLDDEGEFWRVYDFVEDSVCLQKPRSAEDFYKSAVAFGLFQKSLLDFPAETLCETIPNFHNTPNRYVQFKESLEKDPIGRAKFVADEIAFILDREKDASYLQERRENGTLPVRVTHNDTKLNNIMFDAKTGEALCIIDLDTVMPGLVAYDFGDSIRFGAATAAEDEKDLSLVSMDLSLYETFIKGFVPACDGLTKEEIISLPYGAKIITLENALRFLKDYIDGDVYYKISYPEHNLDRARTQIKLVSDMESKFDEILSIATAV